MAFALRTNFGPRLESAMVVRIALLVALAVLAGACSENKNPTAPTPRTSVATPVSFSVVSPNVKFAVPAQFRAVGTYSDNSSVDVTEKVRWSSSTSLVSVSASGVVTSNTFVEQAFIIHAEWDEPSLAQKKVSSPSVTMEGNPDVPGTYTRLIIDGPSVMALYERRQLAVYALYSNGVRREVTSQVTGWEQTNITGAPSPYNVLVSRNGMAYAQANGQTRIRTAFLDGNVGRDAALVIEVR